MLSNRVYSFFEDPKNTIYPGIFARPGEWITSEGAIVQLINMTKGHLAATICMLEKKCPFHSGAWVKKLPQELHEEARCYAIFRKTKKISELKKAQSNLY